MGGGQTAAMEAHPDAQFCSFPQGEGLEVAEIGHWATYELDSADPGQCSTGWITQNQLASVRDVSTCQDLAGRIIRWGDGQDPVSNRV